MSEDYESGGWSTMESDPSVFSELLRSLGVPLIVDDLYALDASLLASLQPIYALIFLFKWVSNTNEKGGGEGTYDDNFTGFFANQVCLRHPSISFRLILLGFAQVVNNACATVAVLNGVCNIPSLTMGTELSQFKSFTTGLDPRVCLSCELAS
jgi:ubiquitin carboxyl-terminal hydrolase L5